MSNEDADIADRSYAGWGKNAAFWDDHMGADGNLFHQVLVGPSQLRLLDLTSGDRVLDIACGNGQFAREIAARGADVLAFDFSAKFIERAQQRTDQAGITNIDYRVIDATDEAQLLALGDGDFDAAVCTMALMDISTIDPLLAALPALLSQGGRFVFSVQHPCFNSNGCQLVAEEVVNGELVTRRGIQVHAYLDLPPGPGVGAVGQPEPHFYFHRPLHELLGACFSKGFVMDGIEEPAFPPEAASGDEPHWRNYQQIPPALVVRMGIPG